MYGMEQDSLQAECVWPGLFTVFLAKNIVYLLAPTFTDTSKKPNTPPRGV